MVAYVSHFQRHGLAERVLHRHIPLQRIRHPGSGNDTAGRRRITCRQPSRTWPVERTVLAGAQHERNVVRHGVTDSRSTVALVEDAEPGANRRVAVALGVPGDTNAWGKHVLLRVLQVLVRSRNTGHEVSTVEAVGLGAE